MRQRSIETTLQSELLPVFVSVQFISAALKVTNEEPDMISFIGVIVVNLICSMKLFKLS